MLSRRIVAPSFACLLTTLMAAAQPPSVPERDPAELLLTEDPSPLASRLTVRGELMSNNTYRLTLLYEPGRRVVPLLGEPGGIERLTFLVFSQPSASLLLLVHCGGDEAETAVLGREHNALTHAALSWSKPLEATVFLPRPPLSDDTLQVELLALDRRAQVLGAKPNYGSFSVSSLFREVSSLEGGSAVRPE